MSKWTPELVIARAAALVKASNAVRMARGDYREACEKYRRTLPPDAGPYIRRNDPVFHLSTQGPYSALWKARYEETKAKRRLETAVRNCPDIHKENAQ